jgi:hypothetical protein
VKRDVLEFELRSLPGVVGAAVDEGAVTVLLLPDVDAGATRIVVEAVLATHGVEATVQVLGGMSAPPIGPRRAPRVAAGAISGIGVLASVAAAAAMTGNFPLLSDGEPEVTEPARAEAAPVARHRPAPDSGVTVVPGEQPEWAAAAGPWPLPAVLPPADAPRIELIPPAIVPVAPVTPAVAPAVTPVVVPSDPPSDVDVPAAMPDPGLTLVTAAVQVESEPVSPVPETQQEHAHDDRGLHLGWENGPAHAAPHSSASTAPRGGHR